MAKTGKIVSVEGSWSSGLATITIEDESGQRITLPADNGPLFRALDRAFGGIGRGHTYDPSYAIGKRIKYVVSEWGTLAGFSPEE